MQTTATKMEFVVLMAICGCLAVLFILFRYGRDALEGSGSSVTYVTHRKECHPMLQVQNPFCIAVSHDADNPGDIELQLWSECPCQVWLYWGLSYAALASWPRQGWPLLREGADRLWEQECVRREEQPISLGGGERRTWHGTVPTMEPGLRVSLGVLVVRRDDEADPTQVVALLAAVDAGPGGMRLLAQHVKLAGGQSWPLRSLFVPSGPVCVVCQTEPAGLALLPCRHACLCGACFARVHSCPVCRARIVACFRVDPDTLQ